MRKLSFILVLLTIIFSSKSQTNCQSAQPFCAGGSSGINFPATTNGGSAQSGPSYGCLGSQPNPAWYYLQIGQSGTLDILIEGQIGQNPGQDVDFIAWGPFSSLANVCNSLTAGNIIDCSYSSSFTETLNISNGIAGQYYMVLITNYANVTQNIEFTQYGGTGSTNCALLASNSSICAGSNATIVANNSTNLSSPSYSLNPGGITSPTPTFVVNPLVTTTYTVYVTGTNNQSQIQTVTTTANVTVNPVPNVSPTFTQASCTSSYNAVNLGLSFTGGSGSPNYTVTWNPFPGSVTSNTQTFATNLSSGVTNVTITAAGGCSTTTSFTMAPVPPPVVFNINPGGGLHFVTCANPTITLTGNPGNYVYTWLNLSNSFTGTSVSFDASTAGNYTVTATDPNTGCIAQQTVSIQQNVSTPSASVTPVTQAITCATGAGTFTNTAITPTINFVHEWYCPGNPPPAGPASFTSANIQSPYNALCGPGTYTVILRDVTNGCFTTNTVSLVSAEGFPSFLTSSTTNYSLGCSPSSMTLCITNVTSAINGPTNYLFLPPGTPSAIPAPTVAFSSNLCTTVATPGTWTVVVQDVTNKCQTAMPVVVLQNTLAPHVTHSVVPNTHTLTCFNPTVYAIGSSSTANTTISWQIPSNPPTLPTSTLIIGPPTGPLTQTNTPGTINYSTYTVVITNTVNGCVATQTVQVYQNFGKPVPVINLGNPSKITCKNEPVQISYSGSSQGSQLIGAVATTTPFGWTGPSPQAPLAGSNTYTANIVGIYTLTVQDNKNGCIGTKTIQVADDFIAPAIANPNFTVPLSCGSGTASGTASIQIALSQSITSNQWSILFKSYEETSNFGPTAAIGTSVTTVPNGLTSNNTMMTPIVTTDKPGVIQYILINFLNGCRSTGEVTVVPAGLNADFTADALTGYAPLTVNFNSSSTTSSGSGSVVSIWSFGNGAVNTTTGSAATSANFTSPGTYTVMMISSQGICRDTAYKVIFVEIPSKLEIPNVFTPNGDGSNDLFYLRTTNLTEIDAVIFDRWGNKVYEVVSNTGNIAWDGKNMTGNDSPAGTYFYIIKATGKDGQTYEHKGNVSLYR